MFRLQWPLDCTSQALLDDNTAQCLPPSRPSSEARSRSAPKPCSEEVRLSGVPSSFTVYRVVNQHRSVSDCIKGYSQPSCSVGLYFSALPPALPASDARSRSPPKPCSEETRLSGVPSSFTEDKEALDESHGENMKVLTSIVLGRLVLLAGFSSSLDHCDCCVVGLVVCCVKWL